MSRIICIDANRTDVLATCLDRNIRVSMIETLQSGGTRIVLFNSHDAALLGTFYGAKVLTEAITRTSVRFRHPETGSVR
ncbi:hypothetical protein [Sphingomonas sp. MMS24-J13]|uniref:hypothetical protein n=1 Tax=Sphingomonas sp. MMS24-J13 TaxID=3238686 RepID=UPI00384E0EEE